MKAPAAMVLRLHRGLLAGGISRGADRLRSPGVAVGPSTVNNQWRRCRGSWGWLSNGDVNDGYRLVEVRGPLWARHRSGSDGSTVAVSDQRPLRIPIGRMSTGRGRS